MASKYHAFSVVVSLRVIPVSMFCLFGIAVMPHAISSSDKYPSLLLDRPGRLRRDVVDDAVDAAAPVDDARRGAAEELVGEGEVVGRHAVR